MKLDTDLFKAKIYHGLKNLQTTGDTLEARFLEISICDAFGFTHVGDSTFYADGISGSSQLSVKTRMLNPQILKRKNSRDFQSHPAKFLGPQLNQKQNKWTNGVEIVQRRQKLDLKNDATAQPEIVGAETLSGFSLNIKESTLKYNTPDIYEVIAVHGYDKSNKSYIVSLFWKEYQHLNLCDITWIREGYGVSGYIKDEGISKKVCERVNGNAKREATCFKEFKDLTKYTCSANIKVPLPDPWPFNKDEILEEIYLKEKHNDRPILLTE